jgi:hypothetical protein
MRKWERKNPILQPHLYIEREESIVGLSVYRKKSSDAISLKHAIVCIPPTHASYKVEEVLQYYAVFSSLVSFPEFLLLEMEIQ